MACLHRNFSGRKINEVCECTEVCSATTILVTDKAKHKLLLRTGRKGSGLATPARELGSICYSRSIPATSPSCPTDRLLQIFIAM